MSSRWLLLMLMIMTMTVTLTVVSSENGRCLCDNGVTEQQLNVELVKYI